MPWRLTAAFIWLFVIVACTTVVVQRFATNNPVETDLLTLLPTTERNPNAELAIRELMDKLGNRVFFLVGDKDSATTLVAAEKFAATLKTSDAFRRVIDTVPPFDDRWVRELYAPVANGLLTSSDRSNLLARDFNPEAMLQKHLFQPFATGMATDPAKDPFGLLQHWLGALPFSQSTLRIVDGRLFTGDGKTDYVVIIAEPKGGAFDTTTQQLVVHAVSNSEAAARTHSPNLTVLRAGAIFHGERARTQAESEVDLIGGGSLVGIVLMLWAMFRSPRPLALSLATVASGIACGVAAVFLTDGRIHLITLVFGASLIGEAVDYSIQYFAAHLDAGGNWEPWSGLRKILPGLAMALATSLIGYGALSQTPFPAISQIALFAFVGLGAAWLSVALLLPWGMKTPSSRDAEYIVRWPRRVLKFWREKAMPRQVLFLAGAIVVLSTPGVLRITSDDDVRTLIARSPDLVAQENEIRRLVGMGGSGRFLMIEGENHEQLLQREEALVQRLRPKLGKGISSFSAVTDFVPSARTQNENRALVQQQLGVELIRPLFSKYGFPSDADERWTSILRNERNLTLDNWLASPLSLPLRHLVLSLPGGGTALLLTLDGDDGSIDFSAISANLPGVTFVDKARSVSAMFAEYRVLAAKWIPIACLVILTTLGLRYGWRRGMSILLPTLLGLTIAIAAHGYVRQAVTLFSVMGLLLVLGVGVNYAIFIVEAGDTAPAPFAGVLLSAATTVLSFGLLALSSMPALHQFGFALLVGISASVLLAPLSLVLVRKAPR